MIWKIKVLLVLRFFAATITMRLTTFTDYSLRVLMYLGAHADTERLTTIGDIAAAYGISENHLMKVVYRLGQQHYIETVRGKDGGMRLARRPDEINIGDVVRNTEEHLRLVPCFEEGNYSCPIVRMCILRDTLSRAMRAFFEVLNGQTLQDLLHQKQP
jgi:Rrf2 family nitric oxide-sensitive transcriptional repressor